MKLKHYLLLLSMILLAACSSQQSAVKEDSKQKYKPSLEVRVEVSGNSAIVTVDTDMKISPENYGNERKVGEGHIHMYLNHGEKIGVKDEVKLFEGLKKGTYTLKVSLHNNDHTPYDVTKTVEFEIK